jgi:hypothetical protein
MPYDNKQIAKELQATAQGDSYYGNALYVALDFPFLSKKDKDCLHRYMQGAELRKDRFQLQDIAISILNNGAKG